MEERDSHDVDRAKLALKRLGDPERALIMRWLLKYFEDDGRVRSPQSGKPRRVVVIDEVQFWLVRILRK
jgi:hypothetical protein